MTRPLALLVLAAAVVFGVGVGSISAASQQSPKAVKGELIVGFADGVSRPEQNAILKEAGATSKKRFGQIDAVLVKVKDDEEAFAVKVFASDPRVAYAQPNHVVSIAATPNDPSLGQLWGLHNTGQTGGTNDKDIDAPEAWELATGDSSIVVAVTDTGVDFSHSDLTDQRWVNTLDPVGGGDDDGNGLVDDWSGWDFVNDDNDPFDDHRHGTHVSGTIGAEGDNGVGVVGVNWNVKIMALKFLNSAGSGTTADAIASTLYAADHGADVSSNSWGGGPYEQALLDAIEYGASRGMLFVAAAGNDGFNNDVTPTYPATYASDAVLAVAATDHNDGLAFFSSYGAKSVDLGAPGVGILSTTPGNTYGSFDGTSMATPHVAGAAALVEDRFPGATLYGIKALLMSSVDPAAALAGKTVTGGRLNIGTALACDNQAKVVLSAPANGFIAGVTDVIPIKVLGANCAVPAGLGNVTATVNGTPVALSAATPDTGLYTGSYTVNGPGALTVTATVTIGSSSASQTANGNAYPNYTCQDVPFSWVDVTGVAPLVGADGDDAFSTVNIGFPISFFGQTYSTAYISSNGFLTLGSNAGVTAPLNAAIPTTATPNGVIAPFWDDLYPGATGSVHAAVSGTAPNRTLYVEWFNVPHFNFLSTSGPVTFEAIIKENGDVRFQYLDTSFEPAGNPAWNQGGSATAGVERGDGVVGREISFNQPLLTNERAVSCTFGAPPPPVPTITTTSLPDGTVGEAYSATLQASGGTPPYAWSLDSGSLPAGLTLNSSTGAIAGTPAAAGTSPFIAKVTDSATQSDTQALSIAVAPAVPPTGHNPVADFDGDGDTDLSVFRPSQGAWYIAGQPPFPQLWGSPGDLSVSADYDGDGSSDIAVFRNGHWYVQGQPPFPQIWGQAGDVPVPADYDGDGDADIAVFRNGHWYVKDQPPYPQIWGQAGDVPVPADYDGDGDADIAVFRNGHWYVQGQPPFPQIWGQAGDVPVPADYDGDGDADIAVFRNGHWYVQGQPPFPQIWGQAGDLPVPGDYDASGDADIAVFRDGHWYVQGQPPFPQIWGGVCDIPQPLPYALRTLIPPGGCADG